MMDALAIGVSHLLLLLVVVRLARRADLDRDLDEAEPETPRVVAQSAPSSRPGLPRAMVVPGVVPGRAQEPPRG